jgi:chromosome segregation ATPase
LNNTRQNVEDLEKQVQAEKEATITAKEQTQALRTAAREHKDLIDATNKKAAEFEENLNNTRQNVEDLEKKVKAETEATRTARAAKREAETQHHAQTERAVGLEKDLGQARLKVKELEQQAQTAAETAQTARERIRTLEQTALTSKSEADTVLAAETNRANDLSRRLVTTQQMVKDTEEALEDAHRAARKVSIAHSMDSYHYEVQVREAQLARARVQQLNDEALFTKRQMETLRSQLGAANRRVADAHEKLKQSGALFRRLADDVQSAEELYKSCLWYANTDRDQTEKDSARLRRQYDEQTRQITAISKEIRMYKWAWSETIGFTFRLLGLDTDDMTDDPSESVLDITRRRLRQCQVVKYGIDKTQETCMDKYRTVCERLEASQESFHQLQEAVAIIKSLNEDVSNYRACAITQEARYQAALRERNMFALALRDTKTHYNRLIQRVEGAMGSA